MRIPVGWLREMVPTDLAVDDLAERMTHRGVKVEGVLDPWASLDGVIVARVLEVRDHPGSETLCLARIAHGDGETELVVGVRNMRPGDLVPWAPPGARVPVLDEPLGRREIRGVVSDGMLCSPRELAIGQDHEGILVLSDVSLEPGADLKTALGLDDPVLDIEVEPNRPDFLSVLGVAREVAALTGIPLDEPDVALEETDERAADVASVRIDDPQGCPRYLARVLRGVVPARSPLEVQIRLTACGMRPIDAVVDATNYAMLELGQPLHGFDMDRLEGPGIVVRDAREGERMATLDEVERTFTAEDLLICDLGGPVAVAGVMGGRSSEVSGETRNVLLESAAFSRGRVLLTARRLDLHSEASHRFERGTDPEGLERGAARAAQLISAWTGARVLVGVTDAGEAPARRWVSVRPSRASSLLGYPVSGKDARDVFRTLSMDARDDGDRIEVEIPGYRPDIETEVDLIEEIVRVQGYERVGSTLPRATHAGGVPPAYALARRAKGALVRAGLREIRPAPFASREDLDLFGDADAIVVANPLRADEGFLRTRLTPGLLRAVARNQASGIRQVALFEVGTTFRLADPFTEHRKAGFALAGLADEGWAADGRALDVLDAKGVLDGLLHDLGVTAWGLGPPPAGPFHPGRSGTVVVDGREVGVLGEIAPSVAASIDLEGRVSVGVVGLGSIEAVAAGPFAFREVPRFPPVRRDLAFVVGDDVAAGDVAATIERAGTPLLDRCVLFDVFRGEPLADGATSLAFALDLRAPDRTLTDAEVEPVVVAIADAVAAEHGGRLRTA